MSASGTAGRPLPLENLAGYSVRAVLQPLHFLIAEPSLLFILTLSLMLFHAPDGPAFPYDRFALVLLIFIVFLRACVLHEPLRLPSVATWPLLGLLLLALHASLAQPYTPEVWSIFVAKWFAPFALYLVAGRIFRDRATVRQFETFVLLIFAYLSLTAIFFIIGAKALIFPRFILDEILGIHIDRARGPFLQAVANGLALSLLGLIALDAFRRHRVRGMVALSVVVGLPVAILATKTRAVWLAFAIAIFLLPIASSDRRLRRACIGILSCGALTLLVVVGFADHHRSFGERLQEDGPVEFRMAVYEAGWEMFLKKPVLGWNDEEIQTELSRRINDFRQEQYYFHNTYLEILVQHGLIGVALYLWLVTDLFRIGRRRAFACSPAGSFLDEEFRSLWPVILLVYLVNASFVAMNYQFVNGLLFAIAGMLNAQNLRGELSAAR
jgi:putative inorganic carbon (hco3(-)) transporter